MGLAGSPWLNMWLTLSGDRVLSFDLVSLSLDLASLSLDVVSPSLSLHVVARCPAGYADQRNDTYHIDDVKARSGLGAAGSHLRFANQYGLAELSEWVNGSRRWPTSHEHRAWAHRAAGGEGHMRRSGSGDRLAGGWMLQSVGEAREALVEFAVGDGQRW